MLAVFGAEGENGAKCIYEIAKLKISFKPLAICAATFALTVTRRFSPLWGLLAGAVCGFVFA